MKDALEQLAVFGGAPHFAEPLHVGRPNLGDREAFLRRVNDIFDRRWLTNGGPYEREFEARVARIAGVKHCIAMCNATIALEIAIRAMGMRDEVIVPAFTFVATAHALQWQQITPVFCDINPATANIDPDAVEALITPRTTGIIGVHVWGRPCNVHALESIARRHNLQLLFDAAHALGCTHGGRPVGSFGNAEVYSFHATKFINSFEGGAIVTNDDDLAQRARLMRNFGFVDYDRVEHVGTNGKMSEVSAAMGLTSLEAMTDLISINRFNYNLYAQLLADIPGLTVMPFSTGEESNYQYVALKVDDVLTGISRDELQAVLSAERVLVRRYFYPGCHRMEPYASSVRGVPYLPHTDRLASQVLCVPTGSAVDSADIRAIANIMRFAIGNAASIRQQLARKRDHAVASTT